MVRPIPFAGLGVAAAALLLSGINDLAMMAVSFADARAPTHLGMTLPILVCMISGAVTHYDRTGLSRLLYLATAAAGLLIVVLNMLRNSQLNFISEQVAIASMLLMVMIALYGLKPDEPRSDDDDRPVKLNPFFTP